MTVVKLFEAQAARTPDAIAVRFGQESLTYAQLNSRANQLAHFLQEMSVGKEQMVGLFLERSFEMIIAILGVLKAGGAYVPLDPDYPEERVAFMLEDTGVPILLTQTHLAGKALAIQNLATTAHEPKMICLDSEWNQISAQIPDNPQECATASTLAYTIYTSGSTGIPKGVMNEHHGIYNRLVWMLDALPLTENDRVLQKTPYSFDVSIWEFFWPLLSGACLVLARPGGHKDSEYLVNLIVDEGVTAIHFVPSMLQVFLLHEGVERCHSLRRVLCSGEALMYELQERFFSRLDAELYNLYGPTEAAIEVTFWACQRQGELSTVPIGRPLPNTQIHILDGVLQRVSVGDPGELYIGGVQVARGYLNRPDLTAERFIPDPFSADPSARLYKTGDLASSLEDGTILYLGRIDHQVKIRGNRVELGEIEATLTKHPTIREAVVIAHEPIQGDKRLAAYVVLESGESFSPGDIREFLSTKLPEYMLPATFNVLNSLPLTPSGKVNRQALPAPTQARPELEQTYVAPRNLKEASLAAIWERMIGLERVGIYDNFFELGGDSILCILITSRANQAGLHLTASQILQYQTIAELAEVAGTLPMVLNEQEIVTGSLPLTPIQGRFFEQFSANPDLQTQTFLVETRQRLDSSYLEKSIQQLLLHHDALRLRFTQDGTHWRQEIAAPGESVPFTPIKRSGSISSDEQKQAVYSTVQELQGRLNLLEGPLLQAALLEFDSTAYLILLLHELAMDGVSWRILLEHLDLLYGQLSQGQPVQLPPKTTSFKHWAERLTEYQLSKSLQQELPYWISMHEIQAAHLPVEFITESASIAERERVSISLSAEDTRALMTETSHAYRTLVTDLLIAALAEAFFRWTGRKTLQVDLEGHGRETIFPDVDLSLTLGNFSAVYPVLLDYEASAEPGERVATVKEQLRKVPHGGVGYGVLRYLSTTQTVNRTLQAFPQSEVLFQYLGQLDQLLGQASFFRPVEDFPYPQRDPLRNRHYRMEITAGIVQGRLQIVWSYNTKTIRRSTVEKLASGYQDALVTLIGHCKSITAGRYTPSDFPEANLSQQELDDLLHEINELDG